MTPSEIRYTSAQMVKVSGILQQEVRRVYRKTSIMLCPLTFTINILMRAVIYQPIHDIYYPLTTPTSKMK
jgi:hypothetical protein